MVLRSRKPDGVIQELYGFLNVHYAVRWLLHQATLQAVVDPDQNTETLFARLAGTDLPYPGGETEREAACEAASDRLIVEEP